MKIGFEHHAQLLIGDIDELLQELGQALIDAGVKLAGNPDVLTQNLDSFGIEEARNLREVQTRKAFGGDKRIFIIASHFFTREAQNALLKTFEEPAPNVYFFLIAPSVGSLIPTLRSRMQHLAVEPPSGGSTAGRISKFINSKPAERMKLVTDLLKKSDDDDEKRKIKIEALKFVKDLQSYFADNPAPQVYPNDLWVGRASEVLRTQSQLSQSSTIVRLVIENLCLTL